MNGRDQLLSVLYSLSSTRQAEQERPEIRIVEEPKPLEPDPVALKLDAIAEAIASGRLLLLRGLIVLTSLLGAAVILEVLRLVR